MNVAPHFERGADGVHVVARSPRRRKGRVHDLTVWWREIDRVILFLVLTLMGIGIIGVAAGSAASAQRLSTAAKTLDEMMFFKQHLAWLVMGLAVMFGSSMLSRENARRGAILLACAMFALLIVTPFVGHEINGARRWINVGASFQPSEFYKPAYTLLLAWILSWRVRDPQIPVIGLAFGVLLASVALLMLQPDFGTAMLLAGVCLVLVITAGLPVQRIGMAVGLIMTIVIAAYFFYDNARHRIDAFLGGSEAYSQVDLARKTMLSGGWFGQGLWMGTRKNSLPEAHTDYILSVIGEEFGLLAVSTIALLYCALVVRVLWRLKDEEDLFTILAGTGLASLLGGQAFINIAVNLQLFPSKGMTLPLISYGGSSMIALCLTVGLMLAVTRRNPFLTRDGLPVGHGGMRR